MTAASSANPGASGRSGPAHTPRSAGIARWTTDALLEHFGPLFAEIRSGAVARELARELPRDAVRALAAARFGALRVPVDRGGFGVSLEQLFELVATLSAADSNVGHLLRGHFGYVELVLLRPESPAKAEWISRVVGGDIVGNATSEQTGNTPADISTTVVERDGRWLLNGRKFYSTGTLYADWVYLAAARAHPDGPERVTFAVRTDAPGVTMLDDWGGFGQTMTASGTTIFTDIEIDPAVISAYRDAPLSHIQAFYQLYLVAVVAGIGEEVVRDAVAFVAPRSRTYIHANTERPADDPQVQNVVGRLSAAAFVSRAAVVAAARMLDAALATNVPGVGLDADLLNPAEVAVYQAQVQVLERVLESASLLFEVGGASATYRDRALDRHWRNARVVASHNPAIYKYKTIGEAELLGRGPLAVWARYNMAAKTEF